MASPLVLVASASLRHDITHHSMLECMPEVMLVRTTLALDDDLLAEASSFTGLNEKSAIVREALKALIERESARRLASLGGSEPQLKAIPRRRSAR
jgi:Arc/MetJ family transcription regulator